jgi:Reverse transcriptase (RNA-dependent DNA polymerase)
MDVKNIFIQRTLEEEAYMSFSTDHAKENYSNLICRLKIIIYRLKQSPRIWYDKLNSYLIFIIFRLVVTITHCLLKK